jgi:hypothetical protein
VWLSVSVRGPQDKDFTRLDPRQNLNGTKDVKALTCPHSHFTDNTGNGDGIRTSTYACQFGFYALRATNLSTTGDGGATYGESRTPGGIGEEGIIWYNFGVQAMGGGDGSAFIKMGDLILSGDRGEIFSHGDYFGLYSQGYLAVHLDDDNNGSNYFEIWNGADIQVFNVDEAGNTWALGTKSSAINTKDYGGRLLYPVESTEVWFEDIGSAQLVDGAVTVNFEAIFAQTVDTSVEYHVYVTPVCEEPAILYVAAKTAKGFTVKGVTMDNQPSGCAFDYRVVTKRLGYEDMRLAPVDTKASSKSMEK